MAGTPISKYRKIVIEPAVNDFRVYLRLVRIPLLREFWVFFLFHLGALIQALIFGVQVSRIKDRTVGSLSKVVRATSMKMKNHLKLNKVLILIF